MRHRSVSNGSASPLSSHQPTFSEQPRHSSVSCLVAAVSCRGFCRRTAKQARSRSRSRMKV